MFSNRSQTNPLNNPEKALSWWQRIENEANAKCKVLLDKYNVTRLAQRLEEEGLVERGQCPDDGRGRTASITQKGKKLRKKMWPVYEKVVRENFLCKFSKKELKEFKNFIERIQASALS